MLLMLGRTGKTSLGTPILLLFKEPCVIPFFLKNWICDSRFLPTNEVVCNLNVINSNLVTFAVLISRLSGKKATEQMLPLRRIARNEKSEKYLPNCQKVMDCFPQLSMAGRPVTLVTTSHSVSMTQSQGKAKPTGNH